VDLITGTALTRDATQCPRLGLAVETWVLQEEMDVVVVFFKKIFTI